MAVNHVVPGSSPGGRAINKNRGLENANFISRVIKQENSNRFSSLKHERFVTNDDYWQLYRRVTRLFKDFSDIASVYSEGPVMPINKPLLQCNELKTGFWNHDIFLASRHFSVPRKSASRINDINLFKLKILPLFELMGYNPKIVM